MRISNDQVRPLGLSMYQCGQFPDYDRGKPDKEEIRLRLFKDQGKKDVHYCPDWDFMAIHSEMPEFEACCCDMESPKLEEFR